MARPRSKVSEDFFMLVLVWLIGNARLSTLNKVNVFFALIRYIFAASSILNETQTQKHYAH